MPAAVAETNCFTSVDGTDCPVFEPWPFDKKMHSHELNGPGVKHETAVCIKTSLIVWINGPFVGGKHDSVIFREGLSNQLFDDEAVECDAGHGNDGKLRTPEMGESRVDRKMKANVWAQHEAVNERLKQFNVLTTHFRHMKPNREGMMKRHKMCFTAVAVITQLKFMHGMKTFGGVDCDVACW